jgi:hypothetical protein
MMAAEFASTGALEMSVFHRLSLAKGRNPFRLAPWPRLMALHALGDPLPPEPPPDPPLPPEPPPEPPPGLLPPGCVELAATPPPQPIASKVRASAADKRSELLTRIFCGKRAARNYTEWDIRRQNRDMYCGNLAVQVSPQSPICTRVSRTVSRTWGCLGRQRGNFAELSESPATMVPTAIEARTK